MNDLFSSTPGFFNFFSKPQKNKRQLVLIVAVAIILVAIITQGWWIKYISPQKNLGQPPADQLQVLTMQYKDYQLCLDKAKLFVEKDPSNKDIWQWKALCELGLGKFSDSKISFEKVLSLDPGNEVAKHYLKDLNSGTIVNVQKDKISEQDFELNLDFTIGPGTLRFEQALDIPLGSTAGAYFISAQYSTSQTFSKVMAYIDGKLKSASLKYSQVKDNNRTSYTVTGKKQPVNYVISVFHLSPVKVTIDVTPRQ